MFKTIFAAICLLAFAKGIEGSRRFKALQAALAEANNNTLVLPKPVTSEDYEKCALQYLPDYIGNYLNQGSGCNITRDDNMKAFKRYRIRPGVCKGVKKVETKQTACANEFKCPIGISSIPLHQLYTPGRETAAALAAEYAGLPMIISLFSTTSMETLRTIASSGIFWLDMLPFKNRTINENMAKAAYKNGFKAIVLTLNTPTFVRGAVTNKNAYQLPAGYRCPILEAATGLNGINFTNDIVSDVNNLTDNCFTFDDFYYGFKAMINKAAPGLPIICRGILTEADANTAISYGCDAIMVSNCGGRQMDGAPAAIEALPEVVKAAGKKDVYIEGGARCPNDIYMAMALGAKIVFLGRPIIYAVACNGTAGAATLLDYLCTGLNALMYNAGNKDVKSIDKTQVVRCSYFDSL